MDLVVILLWTLIKTKQDAGHSHHISEDQFPEIFGEADDEGHDQEIREKEQVFSCFDSFHVVHDRQVNIQVQHRYHPREQISSAKVQVIGDDEDIGRAQVDKRADIKSETEIGNDANEVSDEDQQDELIETYRLLPFGRGMLVLQSGIDYIIVKGREHGDEWVAHKVRIRV